MASTTPYAALVTRATDSDDDPTLLYDITDKVKTEGPEGSTAIAYAVKRRFAYPNTDIKRRVLGLVDTLVIECGPDFHKAFISAGFLTTLADNRDKEIARLIPEHLEKWKIEMGSEYLPAFNQAFPTGEGSQSTSAVVPSATAGSTGLTQKPASGPLGQASCFTYSFKVKPVNPLVPFLTMPYVRAQRVLYLARDSKVFHMQSIHIARQALHLVILLNDLVDTEEGPDDEQEDERIDLEDELIELENEMRNWGAETGSQEDYEQRVPEIKRQYAQFFKQRFYFQNARDPSHDRIYKKLLAYDKKTIAFKQWQSNNGSTAMGVYIEDPDGDDDKSEAFIESVRTSPALSQSNIPLDKGKGKERAITDNEQVPPSQVNFALAPGEQSQVVEGQELMAAVSSSSNIGGGMPLNAADELERARQFRTREAEEDRGEQSFRCPVPGCGRTFEKQYLLKHHIREHDDRPYRCPMRGCDRRFATPMEQRVHEALHRIKNMGIVPNMPDFAPPIASTSTVPGPAPTAQQFTEQDEVKSDGKPDGDADGDGDDDIADNPDRSPRGVRDDGQWEEMPGGDAFDEFMRPVVPGEGEGEPSTIPTEEENHMEEDT